MYRALAIFVLVPGIAACGLKGDLYLPPEPPPAAAPAEAPAEAAEGVTPTDADGNPRRQVPPTPDRSQAE